MELEKIISREKLSKIIAPAISFGLGMGLGKFGKSVNHEEIAAVPIVMDLLWGAVGKNHIIPYLAYGAGVAINYLPEIYQALQNLTN